MDDTKPCESCGAPLPRTGTYCLACDTPVSGIGTGLSVAETHAVRRGRPIMSVALVLGCVLAIVGVTYALVLVVRPSKEQQPHHQAHSSDQVVQTWTKGPASMSGWALL